MVQTAQQKAALRFKKALENGKVSFQPRGEANKALFENMKEHLDKKAKEINVHTSSVGNRIVKEITPLVALFSGGDSTNPQDRINARLLQNAANNKANKADRELVREQKAAAKAKTKAKGKAKAKAKAEAEEPSAKRAKTSSASSSSSSSSSDSEKEEEEQKEEQGQAQSQDDRCAAEPAAEAEAEADKESKYSYSDVEVENGEEKKPERVAKWKLSDANLPNWGISLSHNQIFGFRQELAKTLAGLEPCTESEAQISLAPIVKRCARGHSVILVELPKKQEEAAPEAKREKENEIEANVDCLMRQIDAQNDAAKLKAHGPVIEEIAED
jgi:hypothetical protein